MNKTIQRTGSPVLIHKAQMDFAKGETDRGNKKLDTAIDHYRDAWKNAIKA